MEGYGDRGCQTRLLNSRVSVSRSNGRHGGVTTRRGGTPKRGRKRVRVSRLGHKGMEKLTRKNEERKKVFQSLGIQKELIRKRLETSHAKSGRNAGHW